MSLSKVFCRTVSNNILNFTNWRKHIPTTMPFYAVARGRTTGIYNSWPDCEAQVKGFPGARYKKFDSVVSANDFIVSEGGGRPPPKPKQNYYQKPSASTANNLKRSYSTSNNKKFNAHQSVEFRRDSNQSSDDSDGLSDIIVKQMDDIEKRLKSFEKGVDKIVQNSKKSILIDPPQQKRRKTGTDGEFDVDGDGYVQVYTDGACSANGTKGARAGLGVYWADEHPLNISEPVSGRATNNCGEIQAATKAIKVALQNGVNKLSINTDSQFLINSVTKWIPGWKRKGWKLASGEPVKNEKDFKELDSIQNKLQIKWNYVEAHRGIHGNEMADQLAKAGAEMYRK